ncbi:DUF6894 family protein [Lichenibacterium ramalinae]|uniref:DUF6894 family protein n=1 Tax=Lichenibacterium ramalinae TaxID=2316527 RepID=UPI00100F857C|nr:hypothetical protein [Lichenibacterium ramalinae]
MPRYFFETYKNGKNERDGDGCELPDIAVVRRQTIMYLCEIARDEAIINGDNRSFAVMVYDEKGSPIHSASLNCT